MLWFATLRQTHARVQSLYWIHPYVATSLDRVSLNRIADGLERSNHPITLVAAAPAANECAILSNLVCKPVQNQNLTT